MRATTSTPYSHPPLARPRRLWPRLIAAVVAGAAAASALSWLMLAQQKAPRLVEGTTLIHGRSDRLFLQSLTESRRIAVVISPGRLALDTSVGAEVLELFRIVEATGYKTLKHESPVVRGYSAIHLLRNRPERVSLLRPLLSDPALIEWVSYDDPAERLELGELILRLACARADVPGVRRFLRSVGRDFTLLGTWVEARRCAQAGETAELPARINGSSATF